MEDTTRFDGMDKAENETILLSSGDEQIECQVIATIGLESGSYILLHPLAQEGIGEDEALVFEILPGGEEGEIFRIVEDDDVINAVFEEYNRLYDEGAK